MKDPTHRTHRKLSAPEKTLDLNSYVVNQEFSDEKVTKGLTGEMMSQKPPVLSGVSAGCVVTEVSASLDRQTDELAYLVMSGDVRYELPEETFQ